MSVSLAYLWHRADTQGRKGDSANHGFCSQGDPCVNLCSPTPRLCAQPLRAATSSFVKRGPVPSNKCENTGNVMSVSLVGFVPLPLSSALQISNNFTKRHQNSDRRHQSSALQNNVGMRNILVQKQLCMKYHFPKYCLNMKKNPKFLKIFH